jgi:RNA polymerase sigma-70 factor (family 1)
MYRVNYKSFSENQLIIALGNDDAAAFEEIYKRYWYSLYAIAFKQTSSKQDSEELVQTVFERIWKNRHTVKIKNIGAYLTVCLRNMVIDLHRQKNVERRYQDEQDIVVSGNLTEEEFNKVQLLNHIENVLQELPEKTKIIFKLSRYEGKSIKDIAATIGITEKAVEYHITQSIKHLKKFLLHYLPSIVMYILQFFPWS